MKLSGDGQLREREEGREGEGVELGGRLTLPFPPSKGPEDFSIALDIFWEAIYSKTELIPAFKTFQSHLSAFAALSPARILPSSRLSTPSSPLDFALGFSDF